MNFFSGLFYRYSRVTDIYMHTTLVMGISQAQKLNTFLTTGIGVVGII